VGFPVTCDKDHTRHAPHLAASNIRDQMVAWRFKISGRDNSSYGNYPHTVPIGERLCKYQNRLKFWGYPKALPDVNPTRK